MMKFTQGNLLEAPAEAFVNTVNTVGVMGKGIALMFKEAFPANFRAYEDACKQKEVTVGKMFVTENHALSGPHWIINFPTKKHWRNPSKLEWIIEGLGDLREVLVFEPAVKYQNVAKRTGVEQLTPARALIAEMIRRYWVLGIECTYLEVQKLGWFLERTIHSLGINDPLDFQFKADKYGPFSDRLRHLLNALDGTYLHCDKRLSDAGPSDTIWFDEGRRQRLDLYLQQETSEPLRNVLELTARRIDGFESPLGMELLATVDWLIEKEHCEATVAGIREGLRQWSAGQVAVERKLRLFNDRFIGLAIDQLALPVAHS
jgi:hypothetical protein